jgi:hypothetical protein
MHIAAFNGLESEVARLLQVVREQIKQKREPLMQSGPTWGNSEQKTLLQYPYSRPTGLTCTVKFECSSC